MFGAPTGGVWRAHCHNAAHLPPIKASHLSLISLVMESAALGSVSDVGAKTVRRMKKWSLKAWLGFLVSKSCITESWVEQYASWVEAPGTRVL